MSFIFFMLTNQAAVLPLLEPLRNSLRVLLGVPCFVRRSRREDALFVTDVLRRVQDAEPVMKALRQSGNWTVIPDGDMLHIDPGPELWRGMIVSAPRCVIGEAERYPDHPFLVSCALRLVREPVPPDTQPVDPLRLTLKYLEAGEMDRLQEELPPLIAVLQRTHSVLPEAAGWYILNQMKLNT